MTLSTDEHGREYKQIVGSKENDQNVNNSNALATESITIAPPRAIQGYIYIYLG